LFFVNTVISFNYCIPEEAAESLIPPDSLYSYSGIQAFIKTAFEALAVNASSASNTIIDFAPVHEFISALGSCLAHVKQD
jgi:hypothetical protein